MKPNYYQILGVATSATAEQIKKVYRKLALQFHPDRNQGNIEAEEKLKGINVAYETLSNNEKRQAYDSSMRQEQAPPQPQPTYYHHQSTEYKSNMTWGQLIMLVIVFVLGYIALTDSKARIANQD